MSDQGRNTGNTRKNGRFLASYNWDEVADEARQAGLNAHLSKPIEPEALFDTLERLIKT